MTTRGYHNNVKGSVQFYVKWLLFSAEMTSECVPLQTVPDTLIMNDRAVDRNPFHLPPSSQCSRGVQNREHYFNKGSLYYTWNEESQLLPMCETKVSLIFDKRIHNCSIVFAGSHLVAVKLPKNLTVQIASQLGHLRIK